MSSKELPSSMPPLPPSPGNFEYLNSNHEKETLYSAFHAINLMSGRMD